MTNLHTTIPFGDIWIEGDDGNVRNTKWADLNVDDLVASIPIIGLLEPLGVLPAVDGRYQLVYGWRRHRALTVLKMKDTDEVPVVILDNVDHDSPEPTRHADLRLVQLTENLTREDLNPIEVSNGFYELLQGGMKQKDIASTFATSTTKVSQYLALQRLPPELLELVADYKVAVDVAATIARLKDPEWIQAELTKATESYRGDMEQAAYSLSRQVDWLLARKKQTEASEKHRKAIFQLGFGVSDSRGAGWTYVDTVAAEHDVMVARLKQAMDDHGIAVADVDQLQWQASFENVEDGTVNLYRLPSRQEQKRRAADPDLAKAHDERERADRERRAVDRAVQREYFEAVRLVIAKPPVAATKTAALAYSTHVHAPQSKKQACEMLGLEPKLTADGKKDWDGTYYDYATKAREAGDEKAMARIFLAVQTINSGLRSFFEAQGVPTEKSIRERVLAERAEAAGK